jgi:hypothetical protein
VLTRCYVHDHLYSPAALAGGNGTVLERYEYDAYGNPYVLEPNFADDPDGKTDWANPYYFQGKRLDVLDGNSLELMSWPYRDYSTYLGRWYQPDKLGMIPNDSMWINPFYMPWQYKVGLNLLEGLASNPVTNLDVWGLASVCCKARRTWTETICEDPLYGPCVTWTHTSCWQQTLPNTEGCDPEQACCHYYRRRSDITVYQADAGKCCWCSVYYVREPGILGHAWVRVVCEQGRGTWCAHVAPTGPLVGPRALLTCINNLVAVDVQNGCPMSMFPAGSRATYVGSVSCDAADDQKATWSGASWRWNVIHNCWWFAWDGAVTLVESCP